MVKRVQIKIAGIEETKQLLDMQHTKTIMETDQNLIKATFFMMNEVKSSIAGQRSEPTSVDTGRFLNSVDMWTIGNTGIVFTDVEYAKFLEYGTSRLNPRLHFRNSMARNTDKVTEIVKGK